MDKRIVEREGSRILIPAEYKLLRENLNQNYRIISDVLLNTGMRIVEFWKFTENRQWYHPSIRVIDLPKEGACKKEKCTTTNRTIRLTERGCRAIDTMFEVGVIYRNKDTMRQALMRAAERAGIGTQGINPKMYRKWIISWLVEARKELGIDALDITSSMGHTEATLKAHYLGVFGCSDTDPDHRDMVEYLKGWKR
jgi:integrase